MDIDNKYKLIFTERFKMDLEDEFNYLIHIGIGKSNKLLNKIDDKIMQIKLFPKAFCRFEDTEYRKVSLKRYIMLYIFDEKKKEIYISHIFNSKRNYINKIFLKIF